MFHVGRMCCPFVDSGYGCMGGMAMVKDLLSNAASSVLSPSYHAAYNYFYMV